MLMLIGFIAVARTAGDRQNALYEYEKLLCYISAFYCGVAIQKENRIPECISACAVLTACVGLAAYCNFIPIQEYIFNDRYVIRLQSFLKYANTTALLLGCGYYAALNLFFIYKKKIFIYLSSCILIAFYLTGSKAAIPIFLVLVSVWLLIDKKYSRHYILQNLTCMIFSLLILLAGFKQLQTVKFLLIIICIAVSGTVAGSNAVMSANSNEKRFIIIWFSALGIFIISAAALLTINGINIFETLLRRFDYMNDAFTLLKSHWLTGIGPGAWKYYQFSVQTTQYNVTYIHNSWLQLLLEYGILFFAVILYLTIRAVISFIKKRQYTFLIILLFIIFHSFIDIDMSFGIILLIFGMLSGFALKTDTKNKIVRPMFYIVILLCGCMSLYMICEYSLRNVFEHSYMKNQTGKAVKYAHMLEKICPYDSNLQISLAALENKDIKVRIERAIKLSPLDFELMEKKIEYSLAQKDSSVLADCKKYIEMAPKQERTYVKAKDFAARALNNGLCSQDEYEDYLSYLETKRREAEVIDRNQLLENITKKTNE